jgi:uncharacterized protein YecT (DUF1311 family)
VLVRRIGVSGFLLPFFAAAKKSRCRPAQGQRLRREGASRMPRKAPNSHVTRISRIGAFGNRVCSLQESMTQLTKLTLLLSLIALSDIAVASTVYSGEFDYHDFKSPEASFAGRSAAEMARLCDSGEQASNDELAQCSHLKFNRANSQLDKKLKAVTSKIEGVDKPLKSNGEPVAFPFFKKAQSAWATYRDNECYSETYSMGEATERYIVFWQCMTKITQSRVKELDELLKD